MEQQDRPDSPQGRRVKITDKRRQGAPSEEPQAEGAPAVVEGEVVENGGPEDAMRDYLDDLRRLQADFDNYRKRMMREQSLVAERAKSELIARLLPVLDNFDRAAEHVETDSGLQLIVKELHSILEAEGLEEIPAAGLPFDPTVHEAVMTKGGQGDAHVVGEVYRTGYSFKGNVVRPAMVVVGSDEEGGDAPDGSDE